MQFFQLTLQLAATVKFVVKNIKKGKSAFQLISKLQSANRIHSQNHIVKVFIYKIQIINNQEVT